MSASKHTPGPWAPDAATGTVYHQNQPVSEHEDGDHDQTVCHVRTYRFVADTYLIAAAPDLLAALIEVMRQVALAEESYGVVVLNTGAAEGAHAAIAKAKGETP